MTTTYNVYRNDEKVATGLTDKTYTDEGLEPDTEYVYQVSAENKAGESELSDAVTVKTLPIEIVSRETLELAIESADVGDTLTIASGFSIDSPVVVDKDIIIDGGGQNIVSDIDSAEEITCFRITDGATFKNINLELLGGGNRAFTLHTMATRFNLKDSSITGEDTSGEGHRGIGSSIEGDGDVVIDNVVFNGLRVGVYQVGNHSLDVNGSTFENNHRGLTIEGSSVPTLTNNVFTNNDGDISASHDSLIKDGIAQEAENPDNDNTFDDDKPKYNWVTGVTLSPKTSSGEAGTAGERQLTETIVPTSAINKSVTFATEDVAGLSVSSSGKLEWTADTPAGTYETVVTTDDGGFTDTHTLTLEEPEEEEKPEDPDPVKDGDNLPESIEISPTEHTFIDIWEPGTPKRFNVTILPEDADQEFTVESSDELVIRASIDGTQAVGMAMTSGTAELTVTTVNGLTATATITVPEQG